MPFEDAPPPKASSDQAEVRVSQDEKKDKFWEIFKDRPGGAALAGMTPGADKNAPAKVENLGAIDEFQLPTGWRKGAERELRGSGYSKEFVLPHAEAKIQVSYRGLPVSDECASAFKGVLQQPEHKLSNDELQAVAGVLGPRASEAAFQISSAYTKSVDDQRVLMVEGRRPSKGLHDRVDEMIMYIPTDRKGAVVQEVSYRAPHETYGAYVNSVRSAFENMSLR